MSTCAFCGAAFERGYLMNATRHMKPQYCGAACQLAERRRRAETGRSRRFWSKVRIAGADECWEWRAHRNALGYGRFAYETGNVKNAHRVAYMLHYGDVPQAMFVCHTCDNPPCCNPAHLWLGTTQENTADMVSKGRQQRIGSVPGEKNHRAKLTDAQALEVFKSKEPAPELARRLGVTKQAIRHIRTGKNWSSITGAHNG